MEAKVYNLKGSEAGSVKLPEGIFGLPWNADMVHQVVTGMKNNERTSAAHVKDRSEVSGGGRKPWRQKGTGRARHGSRRSPIWIGGGVTHGPRSDKNYSVKINKKMKSKALFTVLSAKLRDGEIVFTEPLVFAVPKAKEAVSGLANLSKLEGLEKLVYKRGKRVLIITPEKDEAVMKSFSNIKTAAVEEVRNINPLMASNYQYIILTNPEKTIKQLEERGK